MFGKDALRVLAALGCREAGMGATQQLQDTKKLDDMVLHFFSEPRSEREKRTCRGNTRKKQASRANA